MMMARGDVVESEVVGKRVRTSLLFFLGFLGFFFLFLVEIDLLLHNKVTRGGDARTRKASVPDRRLAIKSNFQRAHRHTVYSVQQHISSTSGILKNIRSKELRKTWQFLHFFNIIGFAFFSSIRSHHLH